MRSMINQTLKKLKGVYTRIYLGLIDLKAAHDWIPRKLLWDVVEFHTKATKLTNILRVMYPGDHGPSQG